jgi:hypothetical protein
MEGNRLNKFLFFIIILVFYSSINGQALFQGVKQPVTSRSWGMGSTSTGITNDCSGIISNPATISKTTDSWQLSYTSYVLDIFSTTATAVFTPSYKGKWALIFNYLDYGSFIERDMEGTKTGEFAVNDLYIGAAYSRELMQRTSAGASILYANSNINTMSAEAILFSFGLLYYEPNSTLSIGLSYANYGFLTSGYITKKDKLPTTFMIGVSKKLAHLPLILSIDCYEAYKDEYLLRLGGEFILPHHLFLRFGASSNKLNLKSQQNFNDFLAGLSVGFGMAVGKFQFDLAVASLGNMGNIFSTGISQNF